MDDDRTIVGEQPWQDLGERELVALPQPPLLDPRTDRAFRAACWAACVAIWFGIAILAIVLAGLFVGVFSSSAPP